MCKIMAMAGIKPGYETRAERFARAAVKHMTERDNDGFGYAAVRGDASLFAEKWVNPKDAFKRRHSMADTDAALTAMLCDAVSVEDSYAMHGDSRNWTGVQAVILHSRLATCGKGIANTHPFVSKDGRTALIHNGVISNVYDLRNRTSTCDSECILNEYTGMGVNEDPSRMDFVARRLSGYYALAVLSQIENKPFLDIMRDDKAPIVVGYVKELETFVFCTNEYILRATARSAKMHVVGAVRAVNPGYVIRLDAETGQPVMKPVEFEYEMSASFASDRRFMENASKALGTSVESPVRAVDWQLPNSAPSYKELTDNDMKRLTEEEEAKYLKMGME
jgi:predicted glutamine amidotransferase